MLYYILEIYNGSVNVGFFYSGVPVWAYWIDKNSSHTIPSLFIEYGVRCVMVHVYCDVSATLVLRSILVFLV